MKRVRADAVHLISFGGGVRSVAVNQVSLSFYAPRWQQHRTPDPTARTDTGAPVQIIDSVPVVGSDAPTVQVDTVVAWITAHGFTHAAWGNGSVFERGRVRSIFGPEQDIVAHVHDESGEVSDLYIRFTLPRPGPPALDTWAAFVVALCERFSLRLAPDGVWPCGKAEFVSAVRDNSFYQEFARAFGWETGVAEPPAAPGRGNE